MGEEGLLFELETPESDAVFLRSFSALTIALILYRDNQDGFLSVSDFSAVMGSITHYCQLERDYRSFVEGKGWAHAPAHISDALDECAKNRHLTCEGRAALLGNVGQLISHATRVFEAEEDERMATVIISLMAAGHLHEKDLAHWLNAVAVGNSKTGSNHTLENKRYLVKRINQKHFLRCLFMRLTVNKLLSVDATHALLQLERQLNPDFYAS